MYSPYRSKMQNREYREHNLKRHVSHSEKPATIDMVQPRRPASKSESEIIFPYQLANMTKYTAKRIKPRRLDAGDRKSEQYYKRYDLDEVPVKDSSGKLENINLTDSKLNAIENEALKDISEPTLPKCVYAMDPNVEIIKTAVQEILNKFFANMDDFEDYKRRFNDLLKKDPNASTAGMEEFIKEVIKRILSQSSLSNNSYKSLDGNFTNEAKKEDNVITDTLSSRDCEFNQNTDAPNDFTCLSGLNSMESLNYFTQLIGFDDSGNYAKSEMLRSSERPTNRQAASAGDINKFLEEKMVFERFLMQQNKTAINEFDIPVKSACPMMDFHTVETETATDVASQGQTYNRSNEHEGKKSLMSKICGFFCRKLRRYSTA